MVGQTQECERVCLGELKHPIGHLNARDFPSQKHNPHPNAIKPKCANFDPNFASNSKTAHFERKRWAPPFKPCPRGVHWWWSRPNWLSWRRETWLGPSKKCHLGPLWMEGKNCPRGSEKLMGTARANRGSGIFFSAPELKN